MIVKSKPLMLDPPSLIKHHLEFIEKDHFPIQIQQQNI